MVPHVIHFNRDLLGLSRERPQLLDARESLWLFQALLEEVQEFMEAHNEEADLAKSVDALIDLLYFTIGGLYRLGLDEILIAQCFGAVHEANLTKRRGVKATRPNDGTVADAVKPADFQDPVLKIRELLQVRQNLVDGGAAGNSSR